MDAHKLFTVALGLPTPWTVTSIELDETGKQVDISIDFDRGSRFACPDCNRNGCAVHDTTDKTWRHLDFFQHKALLHARVPRCHCADCGVRLVAVPWGRPGSGFTLLFEAYIMTLVANMPVAAVAKLTGETDKRLWRVLEHYVEDAVERIDCAEVEQVGVDETSARRRHDYITLFFDLEGRRLLHVSEGKDAATIEDFEQFLWDHDGNGSNIFEVSCDMSPAFIKGIATHLERAAITFDRFHVSKLLTDALDTVRRCEAKNNKAIKGSRYLWISNPKNLDDEQLAMLGDLRSEHGSLAEAYRLKEAFRELYEQESAIDAEGYLRAWLAEAYASGIAPIVKAAQTIERHGDGILRWHVSRISNGIMEGINSLIQAAKRKARGYRTKRTLRLMAYLIAGKLDMRLPT